jgi:hypothetical protein
LPYIEFRFYFFVTSFGALLIRRGGRTLQLFVVYWAVTGYWFLVAGFWLLVAGCWFYCLSSVNRHLIHLTIAS